MDNQTLFRTFADNTLLKEAVKAKILSKFEELPLEINLDDKRLGEVTRARLTGRQLVEAAFREIELSKSHPSSGTFNPAR